MNVKSKYKNITNKLFKKKNKIKKNTIIINTPDNIPSNETELSYDAVNILRTDFNTIDKSNIDLLVICIYKLNSSGNNFLTTYPYLEYLLYKYPSDFKKKSLQNTCVFPFTKINKNKSIKSQAKTFYTSVTDLKLIETGFLEKNNNLYIFYQVDENYFKTNMIQYLNSDKELWWTLLSEICNHRKILNFPIHKSVYDLFYLNPQLTNLRNQKKEIIEIPMVFYKGGSSKSLVSLALSVKTSSESEKIKEYGSFNYAVRRGGWSADFKEEFSNGIAITNKVGKYIEGGIARFAIFSQHSDSLINIKTNVSDFKKNKDGWKNNFDSIIVGTIKQNKKYFNTTPYIEIKNSRQQTPLSLHLLDLKSLKKWDPFSNQYKIE